MGLFDNYTTLPTNNSSGSSLTTVNSWNKNALNNSFSQNNNFASSGGQSFQFKPLNIDFSNYTDVTKAYPQSNTRWNNAGGNNGSNSSGGGYFGVKGGWGTAAQIGASALAGAAQGIGADEDNPRGLYDIADPLHWLADGHKSAVGEGLSDAGVQIFQGSASQGNLMGMAVGGIVKGVGSLVNAAFGTKENTALKNAADASIAANNSYSLAGINSFDDIRDTAAITSTDIYDDGWFTSSADEKNEEYRQKMLAAKEQAEANKQAGIDRLNKQEEANYMANYRAYGGPIGFGTSPQSGAIDYGFMSDYLTMKNRQSANKAVLPNSFAGSPGSLFALGGDLQTNGADFTTGLSRVDAGGTHERNPYEGVQMGVDSEGIPNLVEEGETIWDNYVFSNRLKADEETKKKMHLPKKATISFADISKKLEKEASERPNDPVSRAALKRQMENLAEQQERQKVEEEVRRAKEAFEAMTPEQQKALMQQVAMQQQVVQQQQLAAQQAQLEQLPNDQINGQSSPEFNNGQEPEAYVHAYGGHLYKRGGVLDFLRALGYNTIDDAKVAGWIPRELGNYKDWGDINGASLLPNDFTWDDSWGDRVTDPAVKAAIKKGWRPNSFPLQAEWRENKDANDVNWHEAGLPEFKELNAEQFDAYRRRYPTIQQALDQGYLTAPTGSNKIKMTDVANAMYKSKDFHDTTQWMQESPENMSEYLGRAMALSTGRNGKLDTVFEKAWSPYGSFINDPSNEDMPWTFKLKDNLTDAQIKEFMKKGYDSRYDDLPGLMFNSKENPVNLSSNYLIDENGNPTEILGDIDDKYEQIGGPFTWGDEMLFANKTANFYRLKPDKENNPTAPSAPVAPIAPEEPEDIAPKYRNEKLRYAGILGPAVGLGLQLAGVGRPDTSLLDDAVSAYNSTDAGHADYKEIGNYLTYRPMDIWFEQNKMDANARATDRAILNNSSPVGTKNAALLANSYNNLIADGELYRKALEYNDAQRKAVAEYNRDTDKFNAEAYNKAALTNAELKARNRQYRAQLAMEAAKEKLAADAGWYNSIYGNIGSLSKAIADVGKENAQYNMISDMWADGLGGTVTSKTHSSRGHVKATKKSKKGGE